MFKRKRERKKKTKRTQMVAQNAGGWGTLHSGVTTCLYALLFYSASIISYCQRRDIRLE